MSEGARDKLDYKINQELSKIAKNLLLLLEAGKFSRIRAVVESDNNPDKVEYIKEEFSFLRKQILDSVNDSKRIISSVLNKFEIDQKQQIVINKSD